MCLAGDWNLTWRDEYLGDRTHDATDFFRRSKKLVQLFILHRHHDQLLTRRGSSCPYGYPLPVCLCIFCSSWLKPPPAGVEHSNQRGVADSNNLRNNIVQNLKFLLPSSYALILHKWSLMVRFNALQWGSNRKIRRSWLKLPVFLYLTLEFVRNTQLFLYVDILSAMLTMWWEEAMYNVFIYHLDLFK